MVNKKDRFTPRVAARTRAGEGILADEAMVATYKIVHGKVADLEAIRDEPPPETPGGHMAYDTMEPFSQDLV